MPETRSMAAKEQKLQRLLQEQKSSEEQIDRLIDQRNDMECELRKLKSMNESLRISLTNSRCLCDEAIAENEQKQALIDRLQAENAKQEAILDRVRLLEEQLKEAHNSLNSLQNEKKLDEDLHIYSLHTELSFANSMTNVEIVGLNEELSLVSGTNIDQIILQNERFCERVNSTDVDNLLKEIDELKVQNESYIISSA